MGRTSYGFDLVDCPPSRNRCGRQIEHKPATPYYSMSVEPKLEDHKLYEKILNIKIIIRDLHTDILPCSAQDIKKLINSKMTNVRREPQALKELYELEAMIAELRQAFVVAKDEYREHT